MTTPPTPIHKKRHIESCTMRSQDAELTLEATYDIVETPADDFGPGRRVPKPVSLTIIAFTGAGGEQRMTLVGSALPQLHILLGRLSMLSGGGEGGADPAVGIPGKRGRW